MKKIILTYFLTGSVVSCAILQEKARMQRKEFCLKSAQASGYKKGELPKELMFKCMTGVRDDQPSSRHNEY